MNRRDVSLGLAAMPLLACTREAGAQSAATDPALFYACDGCEGATEPDPAGLGWSTRLAPEGAPGEPLLLRGLVRGADGRTPAPGVVIYAYNTNPRGLYADGAGSEAGRRHGRLRGWVRTGVDGRYAFHTTKPGVYPDQRGPAHIHLTVVEPGRRPYWIDSVIFDGEWGVTPAHVARQQRRGGSGVVRLQRTGQGLLAERPIVLERHPRA